jgi:hypothetical protein
MLAPEAAPEPLPPPPEQPRHRSAARDPWGHALTWSGLAVAGVGAGLLVEAHRRRADGERAPDEQAYRDALRGAPVLSRAGIGVLAGGGALLVAGVVRFAVVAARGRDEAGVRQPASASYRPRLGLGLGLGLGGSLAWTFELAPRRRRVLR